VGRETNSASKKRPGAARAAPGPYDARALHPLDLAVVAAYLLGISGLGLALSRRGRESQRYMAAGKALPGWAVGLSIFGAYVSSISYFANPGKAFASDWNSFVFSLAAVPAAWIATRVFVPFYRRTGAVSAYEHLERRFGPWARGYAVACFLLVQTARTGTIVYLLALALSPLTGWSVPAIVVGVGALMTLYTLLGGIEAAVLTGVVQSAVLLAGTAAVLVVVLAAVPGGAAEVLALGWREGKFSLGSLSPEVSSSTFWVVLLYGLTINLQNFGADQGYIQRYISARSDREAERSIWFVPALYVPVAAVFFFVGTALFAVARTRPGFFPEGLAPDQALPHFIAHALPAGARGLVVASVLAAAMDSNLTSMATLTLCDVYRRYVRPQATERESLLVLRLSVLGWGSLATALGLAMVGAHTVLDRWWALAGVFSGGVLGLVLLGMFTRACSAAAAAATAAGIAAILWASLPSVFDVPWGVPIQPLMAAVLGTGVILLVGLLAGRRS
jgi:SSS family solute:Na+ symporter